MNKLQGRVVFLLSLLLTIVPVPTQAAETIAAKEAVVLMPLIATGGLERDTVINFENALIESLSANYKVYYGKKVQDTVEKVYKQRSAEATAGKECDDTKCLQDIAMEFQSELIAVCNVKKMSGGGFMLSLKIQNVAEETVVLSKNVPCENCNDFAAMRALQGIVVGQVAEFALKPQDPNAPKGWLGVQLSTITPEISQELKLGSTEGALVDNVVADGPADKAGITRGDVIVKFAGKNVKDITSLPLMVMANMAGAMVDVVIIRGGSPKTLMVTLGVYDKEKMAAAFVPKPKDPNATPAGMVYVKGGCFDERNDEGKSSIGPKLCLNDFYMDKTEVTQEAYEKIIGSNPSDAHWMASKYPVDHVSWDEADAYCKKVGKHLPKELEWFYAATSGGKNETYAGTSDENSLGEYAWYKGSISGFGKFLHNVGEKKPNGLGLYDMSGSSREWVDDWLNNGEKKYRVVRGGSRVDDANHLRTDYRSGLPPNNRDGVTGFRCAQ